MFAFSFTQTIGSDVQEFAFFYLRRVAHVSCQFLHTDSHVTFGPVIFAIPISASGAFGMPQGWRPSLSRFPRSPGRPRGAPGPPRAWATATTRRSAPVCGVFFASPSARATGSMKVSLSILVFGKGKPDPLQNVSFPPRIV